MASRQDGVARARPDTMAEASVNARLEAFCDGVFAIALTLLIIDIKAPDPERIGSTPELWRELRHLVPSLLAFLLSFAVILITWVNHHGALRLVNKASASFMFANGFLLLTVVFIPFPTALLGEFVWTDHAAPAVVLYDAVLAVQAIGWILVCGAALNGQLTKDDASVLAMREAGRNGYFACVFYSLLAIVAFWFPLGSAIVTIVSWMFWLVLSMRFRHA